MGYFPNCGLTLGCFKSSSCKIASNAATLKPINTPRQEKWDPNMASPEYEAAGCFSNEDCEAAFAPFI